MTKAVRTGFAVFAEPAPSTENSRPGAVGCSGSDSHLARSAWLTERTPGWESIPSSRCIIGHRLANSQLSLAQRCDVVRRLLRIEAYPRPDFLNSVSATSSQMPPGVAARPRTATASAIHAPTPLSARVNASATLRAQM